MNIDLVENYLKKYISKYREEFCKLCSSSTQGINLPKINISPYQYSNKLNCYIARDGAVIFDDSSYLPAYQWDIAGGPALMVDYEPTLTPKEVAIFLKEKGLYGKNIGISRIVSKKKLPNKIFKGQLPDPSLEKEIEIDKTTKIYIKQYNIEWSELIGILTFGAFINILDIKLPINTEVPFWQNHIVRNFGFLTADRKNKRFFHYLEFLRHLDSAAWDERSIWARVRSDIIRDLITSIKITDGSGSISFGYNDVALFTRISNDLDILKQKIDGFRELLTNNPEAEEQLFHNYLYKHPFLIDIYGQMEEKPKFRYPNNSGPTGKEYVEPDFIFKYPGHHYLLVELERPNKKFHTKQGHPVKDVTQAIYQVAEWEEYIRTNYELLKANYPNIHINYKKMVIISRSNSLLYGEDHINQVRLMYKDCEILTYDDLINKALAAYHSLSVLKTLS